MMNAPIDSGANCLSFLRCMQCGKAQTLTRYACTHCGSERLMREPAGGHATVHAASTVWRAPNDAFRALAPYTLVIVALDEGPRLMAHAVSDVAIGDRVQATFFTHQGHRLMRFVHTSDSTSAQETP